MALLYQRHAYRALYDTTEGVPILAPCVFLQWFKPLRPHAMYCSLLQA